MLTEQDKKIIRQCAFKGAVDLVKDVVNDNTNIVEEVKRLTDEFYSIILDPFKEKPPKVEVD